MDSQERGRRIKEKALRKPINNIALEVQNGFIDINSLFRRIDERIKEKQEKENGKISS